MKYNFDEIVPRHHTASVKWDSNNDPEVLPMWVADMDFKAAPPILDALRRRLEHGVFGYGLPSPAYYKATCDWFSRRHGLRIEPEWILPVTGVVPALSAILRALTKPGDKVIIQSPAYNHFFHALDQNDCRIVENPLIYADGTYSIDFEDLERKAADPETGVLLFCNPHNPGGRVWSREELQKVGEICLRHDILVIADEIHCELVMPGHTYTPFASLGEEFLQRSITCTSPSKGFNLAGLQAANIFVADAALREKIDRARNQNEVGGIGPFGIEGVIAAYNEGEEWLGELNRYLWDNYCFLRDYLAEHLRQLSVLPLEGTYLAWIDCSQLGRTSEQIAAQLLDEGKVWVNSGTMYGPVTGEGFLRLNIACPRALLAEGLERMRRVVGKM